MWYFPFLEYPLTIKTQSRNVHLSDGKLNNSVGTRYEASQRFQERSDEVLLDSLWYRPQIHHTWMVVRAPVLFSESPPLLPILFHVLSSLFFPFPSGALCLARVWYAHCRSSAVWIRCACACGCGEGSGFPPAPLSRLCGDYRREREPRPWLHPRNQWPNGNYTRPTDIRFPPRSLADWNSAGWSLIKWATVMERQIYSS